MLCSRHAFLLLLLPSLGLSAAPTPGMTEHEGSRIVAEAFGAQADGGSMHGLFPDVWPGYYDGTNYFPRASAELTLETLLVALVRIAELDAVHYDRSNVSDILQFASPEGVPTYLPAPSPRSVPFIAAALDAALIDRGDLARLRLPIGAAEVERLARQARSRYDASRDRLPQPLHIMLSDRPQREAASTPSILTVTVPEFRLVDPGSRLARGTPLFFPLGPSRTLLGAGMEVDHGSLGHQAQSILGTIENSSQTTNAVGVWGDALSRLAGARVWGGFFRAESSAGAGNDAQLVGLEINVVNHAAPGSPSFAAKDGLQIVGLGSSTVSAGIHILSEKSARWNNGILFASDAIAPEGAILGVSRGGALARGIDMSGVRFTDSALALGPWSAITFKNETGPPAAIFTDSSGRLILKTGTAGVRIVNAESSFVLEVTPDGDIITMAGRLSEIFSRLERAEAAIRRLTNATPDDPVDAPGHTPLTLHD